MTQDQYGQSRGPGYVERGDVVPEDETAEARTEESEESRPMTRFQKVASALLGSGSERDEQDQAAADRTAADRINAADRTAADRYRGPGNRGPDGRGPSDPRMPRRRTLRPAACRG